MSKQNEKKVKSIYQQAYDAAKIGDFDKVKKLTRNDDNMLDMILMGAYDGKQKEICNWALENGACIIWICKHPKKKQIKFTPQFTRRVSMLKGPGDVPRGIFKKSNKEIK